MFTLHWCSDASLCTGAALTLKLAMSSPPDCAVSRPLLSQVHSNGIVQDTRRELLHSEEAQAEKEACNFGSAITESQGAKEQGQGDPADEKASLGWYTVNNTASDPRTLRAQWPAAFFIANRSQQLVNKSRDAALQWPNMAGLSASPV